MPFSTYRKKSQTSPQHSTPTKDNSKCKLINAERLLIIQLPKKSLVAVNTWLQWQEDQDFNFPFKELILNTNH